MVGAVGALALLLLFVVGISANLARGRKSECHCFGQLHSASAGPKTLARNGVLVAVAAVVVWQGRDGAEPSALGWIAELTAGELVALVLGLVALALLAGQWWFLLNLLRYNGRLLVRLEALEARLSTGGTVPAGNGAQQAAGLPVGSEAPEVKLPDLQGNTVELEDFRGEETLVLFWNPGCGFCQQMLPDLKEWDEDRPEDAPKLLVVSAGTEEASRKMGLSSMVVLAQHFAVGQAFGASGTPSGVLVDAEGKVASDLAVGAPAVLELVGASHPRP